MIAPQRESSRRGMDSFESKTVTDPAGFSCVVKIIPADADKPTKARMLAYNRQAKSRAKRKHDCTERQSAIDAPVPESARTGVECSTSPGGRTKYAKEHGHADETEAEQKQRGQRNRKRLDRERKRLGHVASSRRLDGRGDVQFEARQTPKRGENTYFYELSPEDALSPASRTRLQVRRAKRLCDARKTAAREEKKARWEDARDMYADTADRGALSAASQIQQEHATMEKYFAMIFSSHPVYP